MILVASTPFRRGILLAIISFTIVILLYQKATNDALGPSVFHYKSSPSEHTSQTPELPLPDDYYDKSKPDEFCDRIYGLGYLRKYRDSRKNYCEKSESISDLTCFQESNHNDQLLPFCVAEHVLFDPSKEERKFQLNCEMRKFPTKGPDRALPLAEFPEAFFHTGPGVLLVDYFDITNRSNPIEPAVKKQLTKCSKRPKSNDYTILVKRDHTAPNHHWHSLWEIFSLYLSLDILQITPRNGTNKPFFTAEDVRNAQIIVIDDKPMGMMASLWNLFAEKPIVYLPDFAKDGPVCLDNVLLPLPGSANLIWTGDWNLRSCTESKLVDTFVKRIMKNYGIRHPIDDSKKPRPLRMTVISRKNGRRRIKDRTRLVEGIRKRWPKVEVNEVDLGDYPYEEQLEIAANSDIMIGTHGAGLTMQLFMAPRSAVVEIKPYDFIYWGFRNMAKFRNSPYFTIHAEFDPTDTKGWQQIDEITLDENKFYTAVDAAVHAVQQRGYLAADTA